jgi:putative tryptophan/tyrosine transport system substrate-binding protein
MPEKMMWYSAVGCIVMLTLSLLAAPLTVTAQPRSPLPRVGILDPGSSPGWGCLASLRQGLRDLGYVEGQTITLVERYADNQADRLPALAAELVRLTPDVLWTHATHAAQALKQATTTLPIVVGVGSFDAAPGLVESLARPGGNLTGLDLLTPEVLGRRLALLKETVPTVARVAVVVHPANPAHMVGLPHLAAEAQRLGVQLQHVEIDAPEALEGALAAIRQGGVDALMLSEGSFFVSAGETLQRILAFAAQHRLPTISGGRNYTAAGVLLGYGAYAPDLCQRSAVFVDKILKGAKPADLPVERAQKFEFIVNLKTAQALGITIPPTLLFLADEVIR